jgi:rhamnosyltransferase
VRVIIPVLHPQSDFFENTIPLVIKQSISNRVMLISSSGVLQKGDYESIVINKCDFNHANTRNIALEYEDDFYLFMTQDALPADIYLIENLLKNFQDENVVVSYARQIPYPNADPIEVFARETNYPSQSRVKSKVDLPELGIKTFFSSDSCALYRGDYFREAGGFKKDVETSEDMEFAARAIMNDKKIAYASDAKVFHSHNFTLTQVWHRYQAIGRFFAENRWILDTVASYKSTESTGIQQAMTELLYLIRHTPLSIPRSIALSITKYIAFKSSF